jgi:hypothetical protein
MNLSFLTRLTSARLAATVVLSSLALTLLAAAPIKAPSPGQTFATPEDAVAALASAVKTTNRTELRAIFGPATEDLVNPDPVQATNEFAAFAAAFNETHRLVSELGTRTAGAMKTYDPDKAWTISLD